MTERYFEKFPYISYANTIAVNITERTKVLNSVYKDPLNYYQYDVVNNERADGLANRYYNDQYMSWILYMTNNVVDPYYEWYMDQQTFSNFIIKKYGSIQRATTKVKCYRNNWYTDTDPRTIAFYNSLSSNLQKYYEPVLSADVYATQPLAYRRKKQDWQITTNLIVNYSVTNSKFTQDELVTVFFDATHIGSGQVCFANSSSISIQHCSNYTSGVSITGSSYIYGTESGVNTAFTTATVLANNIPTGETSYWSPVYYYDYELEQNENNKSIIVLDSRFSVQMADELKSLLK